MQVRALASAREALHASEERASRAARGKDKYKEQVRTCTPE